MAEKEVNEALFRLREEVEGLGDRHPELKERLETLMDDLEERLESSEDENHLHLVEDMQEAISRFEVEHPTLTGIVNQLMVTLSNMGI
jgi:uncharacterized protein YoxC